MTHDELHQYLSQNGYTDLREIGGKLCGLSKFMFTTGLVVGLDQHGYELRYCYENEAEARAALQSWQGIGHPCGPWIKAKGLGTDLLNPELQA